jgi:hypothetical protein
MRVISGFIAGISGRQSPSSARLGWVRARFAYLSLTV